MSQPLPEPENRVEMSQNLRATLQRAGSYATEQSHRFVTIEHILLALNEDPEAELMLQACSIDQGQLNADVSGYLGLLEDRVAPGEAIQPVLDTEAARIVNSAVIAAQKSRRAEVNGAIVLAAIIGDGRTPAANMLRTQGLTFQGAIEALQSAQAAAQPQPSGSASLPHMVDSPGANAAEPQPMPPPANQNRMPPLGPATSQPQAPAQASDSPASGHSSTTEDILADARRRINATREAAVERTPPPEAAPPPQPAAPPAQPVSQETPTDYPQPEETAAAEPQPPPQPVPPRPLQTEDSLARFERRPPPPAPASSDEFRPAPAGQPPIPVQRRQPNVQPPPPAAPPNNPPPVPSRPAPPPERLSDRLNPPPSGFGGEALRRPPPPTPSPAPAPPQPMPPRQPPPAGARPPYEGYGERGPNAEAAAGSSRHLPVPAPQPPANAPRINPGQLIENIPRRMRMGVSEIVEIRIARADLQNLAIGMQGGDSVYRHDLVITRAMSVRLRAPEGGFFIETASPETQWIENQLGVLSDEYASWRWTITPQRSGRSRLQLIVSARTVGSDGLAAETALPDQIFEVRIRTNYKKLTARWIGWILAAIVGGLLARFGEQMLAMAEAFLRTHLGG